VTREKVNRVLSAICPQRAEREEAPELYDPCRASHLTHDDLESGRYARLNTIIQLMKEEKFDFLPY